MAIALIGVSLIVAGYFIIREGHITLWVINLLTSHYTYGIITVHEEIRK